MSGTSSPALLLARTALFGCLAETERLAVASRMRPARFERGQMIFSRGEPGRDVYLVIKGRVRLSVFSVDGRALAFKHAGPGETFGEIATLDGGVRTADAAALTRVETMALGQADLNRLIQTNAGVASAAIRFLCSRLRETSEQAESIALQSVESRLARFLLSALRPSLTEGSNAEVTLVLGISQSEVAQLVGASRQKVNAALATIEKLGGLRRVGKQISCFPSVLARIAGTA